MNNKRLLLIPALIASTVVASVVYVSFGNDGVQLPASANPREYSAKIDVTNPLIPTNYHRTFAFELHGGGAYSALTVSGDDRLSLELPAKYSDYAFSWTSSDAKYFQMMFKYWKEDYIVRGVSTALWGFPEATKVELVYNDAGMNLDVNSKPIGQWNEKIEKVDETPESDTKITCELTGASALSSEWSTSIQNNGGGTIYVRSMTVWYTC